MSYITDGAGICPLILVGLEAMIATDGVPETKATQVGTLASLFDPSNGESATRMADKGNGHYSDIRYDWKQRSVEGDVSFGAFDCDADHNEVERLEDRFSIDIDNPLSISFKVDANALRELCSEVTEKIVLPMRQDQSLTISEAAVAAGSDSISTISEVVRDMYNRMNGMRLALNREIQKIIEPQIGAYQGGDASKNFTLLNTTDGSVNYKGYSEMKQEYKRMELMDNGAPIIVGFNKFDRFAETLQISSSNDGGIDFGQVKDQANLKYYTDFSAGAEFTGNQDGFLMYAPGTIQFGYANKNRGSYSGVFANVHRGILPDIYLGLGNDGYNLNYDVFIKEDCSGTSDMSYQVTTQLAFDVFTQPLAAYANSDRLQGTNGIVKGIAVEA